MGCPFNTPYLSIVFRCNRFRLRIACAKIHISPERCKKTTQLSLKKTRIGKCKNSKFFCGNVLMCYNALCINMYTCGKHVYDV